MLIMNSWGDLYITLKFNFFKNQWKYDCVKKNYLHLGYVIAKNQLDKLDFTSTSILQQFSIQSIGLNISIFSLLSC